MDEYTSSYRVWPLWAVLLMTIPAGLGIWGIAAAGYVDTLAGAPMFALLTYALAAGYLNRAHVRVSVEGVTAWQGPLPAGVQPQFVGREEIARVFIRYVHMSPRSGQAPYWAAGVERRDGVWVDLTDPLAGTEVVRSAAAEIAQALEWEEPIAVIRQQAQVFDRWRIGSPLLLWAAAFGAALAWGLYVEWSMRK